MKKNNHNKYYVVVGDNAVMIAFDWHQAKYCLGKYFYGYKYAKGFPTCEEARKYAYEQLQIRLFRYEIKDDILDFYPGKIYVISNIVKDFCGETNKDG